MTGKKVRVLHFSSHDEDCGVAKYQENYLVGMEGLPHVTNKFFEVSPYQTQVMGPVELQRTMEKLQKELAEYDILHIQHEFGLFRDDEFKRIVEAAKEIGKKVVVTVHLSPGYAIKPVKLNGYGPRNLLHYARQKKHRAWKESNHVEPFRQADLLLVHNDSTKQSLVALGIPEARIRKVIHPVYDVPAPPESTEIKEALNKQKGDVTFAITGFLHRYKGILGAVRALKFLPENYKLVLIGGIKADSDQVAFQDTVTDLIDELGLHKRVYITGFVPDDDRLNALIRECDVCIYPYDRVYYAALSSGSLNLAFANDKPVITYPTDSFKEVAAIADGAIVLTDTFAYYELARELQRIDIPAQIERSKAYAKKMAWPKMAAKLPEFYREVLSGDIR